MAAALKAANFDRVARVYRWAEYAALGRTLECAREAFLPQLTGCKKVLALGDGDGRFLARLLLRNEAIEAIAVDSSPKMLQLLRKRCGHRVTTVCMPALEVTAEHGTDLVVTHFFLDCLHQSDVDALVSSIAPTLERGGLWVVSDFGVPHVRWMRPVAAIYVRALYFAFRLLTGLRVTRLPDPQRALRAAGLALLDRKDFLWGLVYTELWERR